MTRSRGRSIARFIALLAVCTLGLQLYFLARIALMAVVDPQSTTFQRSEAWRLALQPGAHAWQQRWIDYAVLPVSLKRAVIASEDSGFTEHSGVEWDALEKAWGRNERADAQAARRAQRQEAARSKSGGTPRPLPVPKVVGGSTITQQLAKNLFLSGERNFVRKGQELVLSFELEAILGKQRILAIYLNSVEWGEGVFGAEAAARRYFAVDAARLGPQQAAQLAVMLPAPKRFEKRPGSAYVVGRAATVVARMGQVELP
ncbi:MAG: transglycosylase domain-containing protein [Caldimonas sp.]